MLAFLGLGVVVSYSVSAEEKAGGGGDLRAAAQNPISSLISLPFKFTVDQGANNGDAQILNINPVVPASRSPSQVGALWVASFGSSGPLPGTPTGRA